MRIGILGGTFDPPHICHIAVAETAAAQLELDEVIFIPAAQNPLKARRGSHPKDRLEMTRRAVAGHEKLSVSDIEVARGGKSYTVETLTELQIAKPGDYWLIVGTDALRTFERWKSPEKILLKSRLAIAIRPPYKREDIDTLIPPWVLSHIDWLEGPACSASSTDIRLRIDERKPITHLVAPSVLDYIEEKKLYRG